MKYLSLLAILGLLVGCTSDLTTEEVPQPPSVPEQKISHVVPVEQALEDLQGLLEAIDAPAEDGAVTRSGGIRRVKNVTTVSPEALSPGGTRSEATADVEDLLYIVNFENEAGYAIRETKEQSGILLKTRWNQTKPYNYLCPIENGKNCFAGCVPVAVAQILVFNALNYNKKFYQIGDQLLNEAMWLNIEEAVTHPQLVKPVVSGESMNAQTWAVAYFINKMGEAVGVKYHSDDGGSPAPTKNVVKLLQYLGDIGLGYSNIALSPITTDKVRDMIFVKKLPFYYSGKSSTNSHAWVLDGWLLRERRVITRYAFLPTQYHTESKEFVHANFGWGGQKDGYYTFNAFYTDRGPVSPQSIEDRDYDHDFSAVTYNLSK